MRILSRIFIFLLILVVIIGLFIGFLPSLISSSWGTRQVTSWINHSIPGKVEIRSMQLQWGKGQSVEGVTLKDPQGQVVLSVEKFNTESSLWQLLMQNTHIGSTSLTNLNTVITTNEKGISNLQNALGMNSKGIEGLPPSSIELSHVNADVSLFSDQQPLAAHIKGTTRQDNLDGSFEIDLLLNRLYGENWEDLSKDAQKLMTIEGSKEAQIHVKIVNFPMDFIDRLLALKKPELGNFCHTFFGDKLNLTIDKENSHEGLAFNLALLAPKLQGDVKGKISKGLIALQEPALFHLDLSPDAINPFIQPKVELRGQTTLSFILEELNIPLKFFDNEAADPCEFSIKGTSDLTPASFFIASLGEVKLLSLKGDINSPACDKTIKVMVKGQGSQGKEPFDLQFNLQLDKPVHLEEISEMRKGAVKSTLKVNRLPTSMAAPFLANPDLVALIGPNVDLAINLQGKNEVWNGEVEMKTPQLIIPKTPFKIDQNFSLAAPLNLIWSLDAVCLQKALGSKDPSLNEPCAIHITIEQLIIPLDKQELSLLNMNVSAKEIQLNNVSSRNLVQLKDILLHIRGSDQKEIFFQLDGIVALLKQEGAPDPLLNEPVTFALTSVAKIDREGHFSLPQIKVKTSGQSLNGSAEANVNAGILTITKPVEFHYTLIPQAFAELRQVTDRELPTLLEPSHVEFKIDPASFDFNTDLLSTLAARGHIAIDQMALQGVSNTNITLENVILPWSINNPLNKANVKLNGEASSNLNGKKTKLALRLNVQNLFTNGQLTLKQSNFEIIAELFGIPTSLASSLVSPKDLSPLLGPLLDLELKTSLDMTTGSPGYWDMFLDSGLLSAKARIKIDEAITLYQSNKPTAQIKWTITPQSYTYLRGLISKKDSKNSLTLREPVTLTTYLTDLNLPVKNSLSWADHGQMKGEFETTEIGWKELPKLAPFTLKGSIQSTDLKEKVFLAVNGTSQSSSFDLQSTLSHLFSPEGKVEKMDQMVIDTQLNAKKIPLTWFRTLLIVDEAMEKKLDAILGPQLDATAKIQLNQLNGPIQADLSGSNGSAHLDGKMTKGALTLSAPFTWNIKVTPQLGSSLLEKDMPLLSSIIDADKPLTLTIDPAKFYCPIVPFDFNKIVIGKGSVDFGKVKFRNEGSLKSVLALIRPIPDNQIIIWFTPLYFQLNKGKMALNRIDLLVANLYTLAAWGDIDLNTHKMDLILGLSAQALQYAFNIQGLSNDYMLQVPIKGRNGSVDIDKSGLTARISSLIAQSQGGTHGKILGTVIDMALAKDLNPNAPKPTTQPFPWGNEFNVKEDSKTKENPQGDTKKKNKKSDTQDLIKEGASSLLKQLLK